MSEEANFWKNDAPAPVPFITAELRSNPALIALVKPISDAAEQMSKALDALKASQDAQVAALAERIEVRDTTLIATLREIVVALGDVKPIAHLESPVVNVAPSTALAPVVNVPPAVIEVKPTIIAEATPRVWTFTHTYDGFGNITSTKAVPSQP